MENENVLKIVSIQFKSTMADRIERFKKGDVIFDKQNLINSLETAKRNRYVNNSEYIYFKKEIIRL